MEAYRQSLSRFVYPTGMLMRPVFAAARAAPAATKRVAYAEGEDERVLRAVQMVIEDELARPILIGRPAVIEARIAKAGLRLQLGKDFECVNPEDDPRFRQYWETYHQLMGRHGVTPEAAKAAVRRSNTTIASLMVKLGDADAMLCGLVGRFDVHLDHIRDVIGLQAGARRLCHAERADAGKAHAVHRRHLCQRRPQRRAAGRHRADGRRGGAPLRPAAQGGLPVALQLRLVQPAVGAQDAPGARPVLPAMAPDVECDGELQGDAALSEDIRHARADGHHAYRARPTS